jgi:hypothetical protein
MKIQSLIRNTLPKTQKPNNTQDSGCKTMMTLSKKIKRWSKKRNLKSSKVTKKLTHSSRIKSDRKSNQKPKKHKRPQFKQTLQTFSSGKRRKSKLKDSLHRL